MMKITPREKRAMVKTERDLPQAIGQGSEILAQKELPSILYPQCVPICMCRVLRGGVVRTWPVATQSIVCEWHPRLLENTTM
jgi:hypothetical protein